MMETNKSTISKLILKTLFFIGVILAIGILSFTMARYIPRAISSIGTASASLFRTFIPAEKLNIESSKNTVKSGERFSISWPLVINTVQDHTLSFACNNDLTVYYIGGSDTRIPVKCNDEFKIGKSNSASIEVNLKKENNYTDVQFTIIQRTEGAKDRRGTKTITVTTKTQSTSTLTSEAESSQENTKKYSPTNTTYTGPADLIISKPISGYINPVSGLFFPANSISASDIGAINFTVTNNGGTHSGPWTLSATLPTQEELFTSVDQTSLAPGASVLFTLRLGEIQRNGNYSIVIVVDNRNTVYESNENNNSAESTINISGGGNGKYNSGKADLIIKNVRTRNISGNDIGVIFEVQNIGGRTAKDWRFNATLPTINSDDQDFESKDQPDLGPGDSIEYTLGFDNPKSNGYIEIEVDQNDDVDESNENNNNIKLRIN